MKQTILLGFYLFAYINSIAQQLTVKNQITQEPIFNVEITSPDVPVILYTNVRGQAELTEFKNAQRIVFRSQRFKTISFSYKELESMRFLVELIEDNIDLKEVVVSTNRRQQKKIETPNRIEVINMKEAAFQNPQTAADLLGMSGYAFIQKSQLGGGSPMLRGMATNRVLLVVDDVRMNNAIFRSGNLQNVISLDANALEGTEILFGPGSVMYGSDAIGGVMSFTTLQPKFSFSSGRKALITGNALARFSSANMENTSHLDLNIGLKKLAFTSSLSYSNYNDLRSGSKNGVSYLYRPHYVQTIDNKDYMVPNNDSTLQIGTKYSQINFMQKARYQVTPNLEINYGFHFSETSKYNRYDRLYVMQTSGPYKNKLRWAEWYYGPQKWQMHRFGLIYDQKRKAFDQVRLTGAFQFFEESRYDREFMFREIQMQKEQVRAYSLNIDLDKEINSRVSITYGAEVVYNKVRSMASLISIVNENIDSSVTRYPDGSTWESYGVYATAKYKWSPKLSFSAGLRYNQFRIKAEFDTTFFPFPFTSTRMRNGSPSGNLGLVYIPNQSAQVYFNAATGFRAPNIDDMGKVFESVPGYLVVPNPNLKPEQVYNLEVGAVKSFANILSLDLTGYYTWLTNAMVRKNYTFNGDTSIRYLGNKSTIQAIQNVTQIQVYGIQAGIDMAYKGFGFRSNLSYQKGREQSPDSLVYYPLRHAAPMFGSSHFTYRMKKLRFDFYIVYNARMNYEDLALTERVNASYAKDENGLPYVAAWHTINFKTAYYPSQYVALTFGVENIADRMYRPYSSGINAPGRNFILSFRTRF